MPTDATAGIQGSNDVYLFPTATASAKASYSSSQSSHSADNTAFNNGGTVHRNDQYLVASAGASAGSYTGLDASANLIEAEDERSKVKVGLSLDTGVGVKDDSFKANFLGFGISLGKETGIKLPVLEANFKFW